MIKCNGHYEDFGGKTDSKDSCIEDTVSREAAEESNFILDEDEILDIIKNQTGAYASISKYIVFFVKTDKDYKSEDFGKREYYENVPRTVEWISYDDMNNVEFIRDKLHMRLKFQYFFQRVMHIHATNKKYIVTTEKTRKKGQKVAPKLKCKTSAIRQAIYRFVD